MTIVVVQNSIAFIKGLGPCPLHQCTRLNQRQETLILAHLCLTFNKFPTLLIQFEFVLIIDLATPTHFISSPWLMPRRKKCPRMNKESPNCQDILPRMTPSSANQDHGRGKRHATKGSLLEHPKGKPKRSRPAIGVWWKSNSRRGCHLRITYPQLTSWPHLCGRDPQTVLSGSQQLTECQKEWLMGRALKQGHG